MGPLKAMLHAWRVRQSERRELEKELARSPRWRLVRDKFLKVHVVCEACGSADKLQVHHVKPYHLHPELELEPTNLIALCMGPNECHLAIGHGGNFECFNPNVLADAAQYRRANAIPSPADAAAIVKQAKAARLKDEPSPVQE